MHSHWYNTTVVVLWLGMMGWLVTTKVLPSLLVGEPPSYREIIEAQCREPAVGWKVELNGRAIGWALTDVKLQATGLTEIHGRVHFDTLPIDTLAPGWLQPFSRLIGRPIKKLQIDARNTLLIDPFGRLLRFDSIVQLEPLNETISMQGVIEGRKLLLTVRSGSLLFSHEVSMPPKALLADALSPQTRLPGLRAGQEWKVPILNPLWPANEPIEIIHATVEGPVPLYWNGTQIENTWLVVYRNDLGNGGDKHPPRGMVWVRPDGAVLKQQATFSNSNILFVRLSDKETTKLITTTGPHWWTLNGNAMNKQP